MSFTLLQREIKQTDSDGAWDFYAYCRSASCTYFYKMGVRNAVQLAREVCTNPEPQPGRADHLAPQEIDASTSTSAASDSAS